MSTPLESDNENFLDEQVVLRGGFTIKLNPKGYKGLQDRLVVLPGRMFLAELKRPRGGVVARLQRWWQKRFTDLGHEAVILSNRDEIIQVLDGEGGDL